MSVSEDEEEYEEEEAQPVVATLGCSRCRWSRSGCRTCRGEDQPQQPRRTQHEPAASQSDEEEEEEEEEEERAPRPRRGAAADEEYDDDDEEDDDAALAAEGNRRRKEAGAGLTARQRALHAPGSADAAMLDPEAPRERATRAAVQKRVREDSPGRAQRKEAARVRVKERKLREAEEEQAKAMAKVLSGDGSRKKRDAKAQKAQEERLAAKQLPAPVQPGTVRTKCGLTGTLLLFAEGERPYWEG